MNLLNAIILALVEGVTEFLPVSSTGHLVLTSYLLHIAQTDFVKSFEIIIQLGAIVSVIILYRKKLTHPSIAKRLLVALLPTMVVGLILYNFIKQFLLGDPRITVAALFFGGVVLLALEKLHKEKHTASLETIPLRSAFIIGLVQSFSVIPGVSRAAATIAGGLLLGLDRATAVEFSFLLAVPTILAASTLDIIQSREVLVRGDLVLLAIGFIVSAIVSYGAVRYLITYIKHHTFVPFAIYRIGISILLWSIFF